MSNDIGSRILETLLGIQGSLNKLDGLPAALHAHATAVNNAMERNTSALAAFSTQICDKLDSTTRTQTAELGSKLESVTRAQTAELAGSIAALKESVDSSNTKSEAAIKTLLPTLNRLKGYSAVKNGLSKMDKKLDSILAKP